MRKLGHSHGNVLNCHGNVFNCLNLTIKASEWCDILQNIEIILFLSSRSQEFTWKSLSETLFIIHKSNWRDQQRCFPVNFAKIFRTAFCTPPLAWTTSDHYNSLPYPSADSYMAFLWNKLNKTIVDGTVRSSPSRNTSQIHT